MCAEVSRCLVRPTWRMLTACSGTNWPDQDHDLDSYISIWFLLTNPFRTPYAAVQRDRRSCFGSLAPTGLWWDSLQLCTLWCTRIIDYINAEWAYKTAAWIWIYLCFTNEDICSETKFCLFRSRMQVYDMVPYPLYLWCTSCVRQSHFCNSPWASKRANCTCLTSPSPSHLPFSFSPLPPQLFLL